MDNNIENRAFTLYIIRHAESESNIKDLNAGTDRHISADDPGLSPRGIIQARLLGDRFSDIPLSAVFSAGYERAFVTAAAVAKQNTAGNVKEISLLPLLTETGAADSFPGKSAEKLSEIYPCAGADGADISRTVFPNENFTDEEQYERAGQVMDYFTSHFSGGEYIAAVSHACFISFIVLRALGIKPGDKSFRLNCYNTGVTKLIFYKGGLSAKGERLKIDYINDAWHLKAAGCKYLRGK